MQHSTGKLVFHIKHYQLHKVLESYTKLDNTFQNILYSYYITLSLIKSKLSYA